MGSFCSLLLLLLSLFFCAFYTSSLKKRTNKTFPAFPFVVFDVLPHIMPRPYCIALFAYISIFSSKIAGMCVCIKCINPHIL